MLEYADMTYNIIQLILLEQTCVMFSGRSVKDLACVWQGNTTEL